MKNNNSYWLHHEEWLLVNVYASCLLKVTVKQGETERATHTGLKGTVYEWSSKFSENLQVI
jgi:hypothetical protein